MDRVDFNRLSMSTDLTKRSVCAACGLADCEHPDAVYAGIIPQPDRLANAVETSGAVKHRSGLYSDDQEGPAR